MSTQDPQQPQPQPQPTNPSSPKEIPPPTTLPITTHHCRFCNHLLLATTRDLSSLPHRQKNALDSAQILPLRMNPLPSSTPKTSQSSPEGTNADEEEGGIRHYTILLSTAIRDRKPTLIRREDGFEKRFFMRCGRCRLVMGYFLDEVHFPPENGVFARSYREGETEGEGGEDRAVYLLPGALAETEIMSDEEKMAKLDREWTAWFRQQ